MYFTFWEFASIGSNSIKGKDGKRDLILRWRTRVPGGEAEGKSEDRQFSLVGIEFSLVC